MDQKEWLFDPEVLCQTADGRPTVVSYLITREQASSGVTRECMEFNMAAGQICKLSKLPLDEIESVERIIHMPGSAVHTAYYARKQALGRRGDSETFVFHGTGTEQNLLSIATNGFIVGGSVAGVPVVNGATFGNGVYTAIGPGTPMMYGMGTGKVVLAQALPGLDGQDSTRPNEDWIVFSKADLLLPIAIITFGKPQAGGMSGVAMAMAMAGMGGGGGAFGMGFPPGGGQMAAQVAARKWAVAAAASAKAAGAVAAAAEKTKADIRKQEEDQVKAALVESLQELVSEGKESRLEVRRAIALSLATASGPSSHTTTNPAEDDASSQDSELRRAILASSRAFQEDRLRREAGAGVGDADGIHGRIRDGLGCLVKEKENDEGGGTVLDSKKRQRTQDGLIDLTVRQPRGNGKSTAIPPSAAVVDLSDL